jgi:pyruvate/2-oxoglutarate dehydrogenase complex dihydrolipoamide dehydrogenase (E3) component
VSFLIHFLLIVATVTVNGENIRFNKAIIASGGYPSLISMHGINELFSLNKHPGDMPRPHVMTNETFFNMTHQPKTLMVIGPGVVGIEMAQAMQRLGTEVTVMGRSGRILPREDIDLCNIIQSQLEKEGVVFKLSVSEFISIELTGKVLDNGLPEMMIKFRQEVDDKVSEAVIFVDAVLVATGRLPNVSGMNLDDAGVEYDMRLGIKVNDWLQSTNPKIFAAGDCCSAFKFTHGECVVSTVRIGQCITSKTQIAVAAADFMARTVIRNALFFGKSKVSELLIPRATFTSPEIASVGLCRNDCDQKRIKYKTFEKKFADNDRSICDGETTGMVRIIVEATSDKILGASIVGQGASNMISEITIAMQTNTGLSALASVIHPYPTNAEAVRQTGDLYNQTRLTPAIKFMLRGLVQVQR